MALVDTADSRQDPPVIGRPEDPELRRVLDDPRRVVPLEAVHNFRDLGGYRLADGRTIGWGRLFRADGLYRATSNDVDIFDALGLRTVIDLRSAAEAEEHGSFPVDRHRVDYLHLPIIDNTWAARELPDVADTERGTVDFLVWAYRDLLAEGAARFAAALHALTLSDAMPAVFHCAAGKDRTGVLAALLLGALGVDHEIIVGDYELTVPAMERMRSWVVEHHPDMAERMGETPSFMLAAHPQAMRELIDGIVDEHGSVRAYVVSLGVSTDELATLADRLAG